jgi:hypothetical protein
VLLLQLSFEKDAPELIIDKNGLMEPFFQKIPKWKMQYVRDGVYYKRVK